MPLWGSSPGDKNKPKWLNQEDKDKCGATNRGWTVPSQGNGNTRADREVLVAARSLTDKLGRPNITNVSYTSGTYSSTADIYVSFTHTVKVNGAPYLACTADAGAFSGDGQFDYFAGSGTARLQFRYTVAAADEVDGVVLPNSITLNGGSIENRLGTGQSVNASLTAAGPNGTVDVKSIVGTLDMDLIGSAVSSQSSSSSSESSASSISESSSSSSGSLFSSSSSSSSSQSSSSSSSESSTSVSSSSSSSGSGFSSSSSESFEGPEDQSSSSQSSSSSSSSSSQSSSSSSQTV